MKTNDTKEMVLSSLGHTWILDLDGSIVKHNGYKIDGYDTLLKGAKDFINSIPSSDMIILLTARKNDCQKETEEFLKKNGIKYNYIIFGAPYGERILLNDNKPSGLKMGITYNKERDKSDFPIININKEL